MKRVVITGPESTGKSTLAKQLGQYLKCAWVKEYARSYIDDLNRPYKELDLLSIAKGQINLEEEVRKTKPPILICDTDLLTIEIWSDIQFGRCENWIKEQVVSRSADLYVLCGIEVPWAFDPQRESENDRWFLYEVYRERLIELEKDFIEIKGNEEDRFAQVVNSIGKMGN